MRILLLLVLLALGGGYVLYQRQHNYPFQAITTPAGVKYEIRHLPDECIPNSLCLKRVVYVSTSRDTVSLRKEAEGLLPWVDANIPQGPEGQGIVLIALEPGFLRMSAPKHLAGVFFAKRPGSRWQYMQQEDLTSALSSMFK